MAKVILMSASEDESAMYGLGLRFAGHEPIECSSPPEALARAPEADVVVTAVRLGTSDGIEMLRELRRRSTTAHTRVIVLAAWEGDQGRASSAGADSFLVAPVLPHVLAREVQHLLDRELEPSAV